MLSTTRHTAQHDRTTASPIISCICFCGPAPHYTMSHHHTITIVRPRPRGDRGGRGLPQSGRGAGEGQGGQVKQDGRKAEGDVREETDGESGCMGRATPNTGKCVRVYDDVAACTAPFQNICRGGAFSLMSVRTPVYNIYTFDCKVT